MKYWSFAISLILLSHVHVLNAAPIISTYAGTGVAGSTGDGAAATSATIDWTYAITLDSQGNLYVGAGARVRRIDKITGIISTYAGNGVFSPSSGDGGPATSAAIGQVYGMCMDDNDVLYYPDANKHTVRVVNPTTGIITTIAGNGILGNSGDGGPALSASFDTISSMAVGKGKLYISDSFYEKIRVIDLSTGIIAAFAGVSNTSYSGDGGPALLAGFGIGIESLTVDSQGNLYVSMGNGPRIRRIDIVTGIINTVAGTGAPGYSGDGLTATVATFNYPGQVGFDGQNNLFVPDELNNRIRRIDALTDIVSTVVGDGVATYGGDGGPPLVASIDHPESTVMDKQGNYYIADSYNYRIRFIGGFGVPYPTPTSTPSPCPTSSPTDTVTLTATHSPTMTHSPTSSSTATLTSTPSATPSATQSLTPSDTPTPSPSVSATLSFTISPTLTPTPKPLILHLFPPNPNPSFGEAIWIPFFIAADANVSIDIYSVSGEKIRSLAPVWTWAGNAELVWDLKNFTGAKVSSGIYIYRLQAVSRRGEVEHDFSKCALVH